MDKTPSNCMKFGDFGKLEHRVRSGWSMSATRRVKTHPASLECLKSFGNGRCISNKISIADAKNMRPSERRARRKGPNGCPGARSCLSKRYACLFLPTGSASMTIPNGRGLMQREKDPRQSTRYAPRSAHPGALSWVPLSARLSLRKLDFAQPGGSFIVGYGVD